MTRRLLAVLGLAVAFLFLPLPSADAGELGGMSDNLFARSLALEQGDIVTADLRAPSFVDERSMLLVEVTPEPSFLQTAVDAVFSPQALPFVVGGVLGLVGLLLGTSAVRKRRVALAAYHAYQIVNDLDAELGTTKLDKAVAGLKAANEWMVKHGWRPLKPGEEQLVVLEQKSLHGTEKQAIKIAAQAQQSAASPT